MDLAIRVDYLTGRYIATDAFNRAGHEWPAHPNRLYSASVAALHDQDEPDPDERAALLWVESLGAPSIVASDATKRSVSTHFVPTNDAKIVGTKAKEYGAIPAAKEAIASATTPAKQASAEKKLAKLLDVSADIAWKGKGSDIHILPDERNKQARFYPSVTPEQPTQWFVWPDVRESDYTAHAGALGRLLARVTRLGHSSSFVLVGLGTCDAEPNWVPDPRGAHQLRTVSPGQLERLEQDYLERAHHVVKDGDDIAQFSDVNPRVMPNRLTKYRHGEPISVQVSRSTESGEWLAFEYVRGKRFTVTDTWEVCRAFRSALIRHAPDPTSPYLAGHNPDGSPTELPHIKVVAPAYVRGQYANGIGMGVAIILPDSGSDDDRNNVYRAIANWEATGNAAHGGGTVQLFVSNGRTVEFQRVLRAERKTMQPETWSTPATVWTTATPILLDRNPKFFGHRNTAKHELAHARAVGSIMKSCIDQGLPEPVAIDVSRQPYLAQSAAVKAFNQVSTGGRTRFMIHAQIEFSQPVAGPLVLGAGRFFGMGLCIPEGSK